MARTPRSKRLGAWLRGAWRDWSRRCRRGQTFRPGRPDLHWRELTVEPLAKALRRALYPERELEIGGPLGLCCRCHIDFVDRRSGWRATLSIEPRGDDEGAWALRHVGHADPRSKYDPGTIGHLNGMQDLQEEIPPDAGPEWFRDRVTNWRRSRTA